MGKNNRQIGSKYEQLAADYLKKQGYCIVERNYYTPYGEIDIIAQQDEVLFSWRLNIAATVVMVQLRMR